MIIHNICILVIYIYIYIYACIQRQMRYSERDPTWREALSGRPSRHMLIITIMSYEKTNTNDNNNNYDIQ